MTQREYRIFLMAICALSMSSATHATSYTESAYRHTTKKTKHYGSWLTKLHACMTIILSGLVIHQWHVHHAEKQDMGKQVTDHEEVLNLCINNLLLYDDVMHNNRERIRRLKKNCREQ